ncbi:hypothetical protein KUTeg_020973 [Tegillarca granosa]|uniref:Major facilitator superfamily (MFS) profile domain-containing protein n=1 Tax=Tegillarca granosa TaxID=220873 RepID=A0ABQ9E9G3_TEGGR|nr:hypothetical protein KUTeg_020973 [Tegillarca granosa]
MSNTEEKIDVQADEQETFLETQTADNRPIDHGWAWMTVLACFGILGLMVGSLKSFGVLLVELSRRLDAPQRTITSIQSVAGLFHLGLAPLANVLSDRTSHRTVVIIGGIFAGVGLIATAYAPSIEWLFVTYGIIAGIGFGLTMNPALVCMSSHFKDRRSLANGLSAAGSGAGSFALPNLMRYLLNELNFQGCLLIIGGILFNTICFALLLRPVTFWTRKRHACVFSQDAERIKTSDITTLSISNVNQTANPEMNQNHVVDYHSSADCVHIKHFDASKHGKETAASYPNIHLEVKRHLNGLYNPRDISFRQESVRHKTEENGQKYPLVFTSMESITPLSNFENKDSKEINHSRTCATICKHFLDISLLKNPVFIVYCISLWIGIFGHHAFFNCLPSLVNEFGISDTDGAFLVSLVGLSDLIGRIVSGWFSDLRFIERKRMFQFTMGLFSIFNLILPHVRSYTGLCIISVIAGVVTGGYAGIQLSVLSDVFGVENVSSSWGIVAFFASFALLLSPFLSGLTTDLTGSWTNAFRLSGSLMIVGSLLIFLEKFCSKSDARDS